MATSNELKAAVLDELYRQVTEGTVVPDKDGDPHRISPSAAIITAATNFLKAFPPTADLPKAGTTSPSLEKYGSKVAGLRGKLQ